SAARSGPKQTAQAAPPEAAKQSAARSGPKQTAQAAAPEAAKQAAARTDTTKRSAQAAVPDAHRKQVLAMRVQAQDVPAKRAAQAPLASKDLKTSRSSRSWWDWLLGQ